jgi:pimeloyl-ACP methyl ester carboxylesterase
MGVRPAADVHDLIGALNYKQVNLYGVSYGTRLALATRRGEW